MGASPLAKVDKIVQEVIMVTQFIGMCNDSRINCFLRFFEVKFIAKYWHAMETWEEHKVDKAKDEWFNLRRCSFTRRSKSMSTCKFEPIYQFYCQSTSFNGCD